MVLGANWWQGSGDGVAGDRDAEKVLEQIQRLIGMNGNDRSRQALLLMGKSAGGVLAWNTVKRHHGHLHFGRVALVLIDPHGAVRNDERGGAYKDTQALWWPSSWSRNAKSFRVYNVLPYAYCLVRQ